MISTGPFGRKVPEFRLQDSAILRKCWPPNNSLMLTRLAGGKGRKVGLPSPLRENGR